MLAETPIWSSWTNSIPQRPLSTDAFVEGAYRRPREEALHYPNIEFNPPGRVGWLLFDLDTAESFECWERAGLPAPNFYAQNRSNGRGHLGYCLRMPVGLAGLSREKPIQLVVDVQRGMTRRLGADVAYDNRIAKNPLNPRWASSWFTPQPFDLRHLLGSLDRRDLARPQKRDELFGLGRNCDLFTTLRQYAYAKVRAFKARDGQSAGWLEHLLPEARMINLGFAHPLSMSEIRQIAKSVAQWTWRRFSDEKFGQIQAVRGSISGRRRTAAAEANADAVLELIGLS